MIAQRKQVWLSVLLLGCFVAAGLVRFMVLDGSDGDDLSSSYVGCRLIAAGQQSHLYAHDPRNFAAIGPNEAWQHAADAGGYWAFLHPYVQTPLWGYALVPLCRHLGWTPFEWVFATLALLSFAALVYLVGQYWAPALLHPLALFGVLVVLWFFTPFEYSMHLMQTHIFFVVAVIAALILADHKWPVSAGLLLAVAAAVKITPAVLIVYWLVRRQWKAATSALVWSVLLWLVTRAVAGPALMATYSATLDRVSHVLLLSANNQSLAAFWMDPLSHAARRNSFDVLRLPNALRLICSALLAMTAALGGWLDAKRDAWAGRDEAEAGGPIAVPIGGLFALVGATIFAPIEWLHYSIVLIAPLMVLVQFARTAKLRWIWFAVVAIVVLNVPPLAADQFAEPLSTAALLRGHFYSEVICLAALLYLAAGTRTECPAK